MNKKLFLSILLLFLFSHIFAMEELVSTDNSENKKYKGVKEKVPCRFISDFEYRLQEDGLWSAKLSCPIGKKDIDVKKADDAFRSFSSSMFCVVDKKLEQNKNLKSILFAIVAEKEHDIYFLCTKEHSFKICDRKKD